jgi:hypothetical protein
MYSTAALPPLGEQGLKIGAAYLITLVINPLFDPLVTSLVLSCFGACGIFP